ncbi:MAG TPA: FecR domain-containing protein [Usitatibacter sp.]|nr:FecR domain-containing protein [Usitatibacter sp.]
MKKISVLLALLTLFVADVAMAAGAVVTSLSGVVNVQTGSAAPRILRVGDEVAQGDTVVTSANSSVVMKFDDGQIAALTANSRMQVSAYSYDPPTQRGNILLSLVVGGMRAITGFIGHNQPNSVRFRAATATIGIRGSDGMIVTDGTNVSVTVTEGAFTFTFAGETITIPAGSGAFGANGQITPGTAQEVFNKLPANFQSAIGGLEGLTNAINQAIQQGPQGQQGQNPPGTPGPNVPPGGTGGGSASSR